MWVNVSGGRLYVEVCGAGPPILLIHGWPLDHRIFSSQTGALSEVLTVIAYDRRGFGASDVPPDLRLELDDIDQILDALGLDSVHLLGMSQGGRIALRYATTRSKRVRSLILQGAIVDGFDPESDDDDSVPIDDYVALARQGRLDQVKSRWLQHPLMRADTGAGQPADMVRRIIDQYSGQDLIHYEPDSYVFDRDVLGELQRFTRPVLILTGGRETSTRRQHAAELMRRLANCQEVVLNESGHLCNLTESAKYNAAVSTFCLSAERAPG